MMSPRVTAMSPAVRSPKWSRLRSICRSGGLRSPGSGASPSASSIASSIWSRSVVSPSSPKIRVRIPRHSRDAGLRRGSRRHQQRSSRIGIGDARRARARTSRASMSVAALIVIMVVAEQMQRAMDHQMRGVLVERDCLFLGFGGAHAAREDDVAEHQLGSFAGVGCSSASRPAGRTGRWSACPCRATGR